MAAPLQIDPVARRVLEELRREPGAAEIVLGGYFALQHYLGYRQTHDIDAWWKSRPQPETEAAIGRVMQRVAGELNLRLVERRFGETMSWELVRDQKKCFSFQIAVRSVALDEPLESDWPPIGLETLRDNVGAKMNALVDRGAPRDFTDIYQVINQRRATAEQCWQWWSQKTPGQNPVDGKRKVLFHLSALETRRPLEHISDLAAREQACAVRSWFRQTFTA